MTNGLGLGDVYDATIERIKAQAGDKSRLGMAALMWISHAERPLRADELCHALAVELGSTDFNTGNIPSISILVGCCQGLITVDKEASTVRLIHFTLQEYLSAHPDIFSRPHSAMAEICLTYLNSQQIKALPTAPSLDTQNTSFLAYCSRYWGVHAKRELSDCARSLALELLKEDSGQISTKLLFTQLKDLYFGYTDTWRPFNGLHCASFFGITDVVASLVEIGCYDINAGDFSGFTPLAWAARNGHEEVVKIQLGREEVYADKPDICGRTPLSYAAQGGHKGVVTRLLGREEVDPDRPDIEGRTPLSYAARGGHKGVVTRLLGREEVDPDRPDSCNQTPLSFAAENGHEGVVAILLEREEVNPDKPDVYGRTPVLFAARNGHEVVVTILLGREEVDPDRPDIYGQTPLSCVARNGQEEVVTILLGREEVYADKPDICGRTPLSYVAQGGHKGVVTILLGREEVDPNRPDNYGRAPLSYAAGGGHEGVVTILLRQEEVKPDWPDNDGLTPLSYAARNGYEEAVKILLGREGRGQTR